MRGIEWERNGVREREGERERERERGIGINIDNDKISGKLTKIWKKILQHQVNKKMKTNSKSKEKSELKN